MAPACATRLVGRPRACRRRLSGVSHTSARASGVPEPSGGGDSRRGDAARCAAIVLPSERSPAGASQGLAAAPGGSIDSRPELKGSRLTALEAPLTTYTLVSGDTILLVGSDGSLEVQRTDGAGATVLKGRAVVPLFVARQGAVATCLKDADAGTETLELRWGNTAVLRVTATGDAAASPRWAQVRMRCGVHFIGRACLGRGWAPPVGGVTVTQAGTHGFMSVSGAWVARRCVVKGPCCVWLMACTASQSWDWPWARVLPLLFPDASCLLFLSPGPVTRFCGPLQRASVGRHLPG
jgi:hypothetical protein